MMIAAGAVACGSVMDAIIKHLAVETPVMQVVAWRYILGAAFTLSLVAIRRKPLPNLAGIRFHTLRGLIVGATGICFFYTLTQLALSEATVLIFAAALIASWKRPYWPGSSGRPSRHATGWQESTLM